MVFCIIFLILVGFYFLNVLFCVSKFNGDSVVMVSSLMSSIFLWWVFLFVMFCL